MLNIQVLPSLSRVGLFPRKFRGGLCRLSGDPQPQGKEGSQAPSSESGALGLPSSFPGVGGEGGAQRKEAARWQPRLAGATRVREG